MAGYVKHIGPITIFKVCRSKIIIVKSLKFKIKLRVVGSRYRKYDSFSRVLFLVALLCLLICLSVWENISLHIIIVIHPMLKIKEHHNIGYN